MSLSAGDWIRIKRLRNVREYARDIYTNKDVINNVGNDVPFSPTVRNSSSRVVGSSKTRRESSKYIDFIASQKSSYVLQNENSSRGNSTSGFGIQNNLVILCNCSKSVLNTKNSGCIKCGFYTK